MAIVVSFIRALFIDNVLNGLLCAAVVTFCVVLGWVLLVGWIGFIGVLFEIEKNTRVMRLKQDKNQNQPQLSIALKCGQEPLNPNHHHRREACNDAGRNVADVLRFH